MSPQPISVLIDSPITISRRLDERATCTFAARDQEAREFHKGEPIRVWLDGEKLFEGVLDKPTMRPISNSSPYTRRHSVRATDLAYLADKRRIVRAWDDTRAGDVVRDILATILAEEEVEEGEIDDGPVIHQVRLNYVPVSQALEALAEQAQFWWRIDADRKLHFRARESLTAPWTLTGADVLADTLDVDDGNPHYRNRQYVRGVTDTTDPQTERFRGDGEQRSFTVGFPFTEQPSVTVISGGQTSQQTVAEKSSDDDFADWYWSVDDPVLTQNRQALPLFSDQILEVTYRGRFPIVIRQDDQGAIENRRQVERKGSGIVEDVIDEPQLTDRMAGFEVAAAKLNVFARLGRRIRFVTRKPGLEPGQLLPVDMPDDGLDGVEALIESVDTTLRGTLVSHEVVATEGPLEGSWQKFFRALVQKAELRVHEGAGTDETLIIAVPFADTWGWSEDVDVTPLACPTFPMEFAVQLC